MKRCSTSSGACRCGCACVSSCVRARVRACVSVRCIAGHNVLYPHTHAHVLQVDGRSLRFQLYSRAPTVVPRPNAARGKFSMSP